MHYRRQDARVVGIYQAQGTSLLWVREQAPLLTIPTVSQLHIFFNYQNLTFSEPQVLRNSWWRSRLKLIGVQYWGGESSGDELKQKS